jgi:hypothetical protein
VHVDDKKKFEGEKVNFLKLLRREPEKKLSAKNFFAESFFSRQRISSPRVFIFSENFLLSAKG